DRLSDKSDAVRAATGFRSSEWLADRPDGINSELHRILAANDRRSECRTLHRRSGIFANTGAGSVWILVQP
ncbi:MAG: hypothetical protein ACK43N_00905, partial [Pirellulaceae bacterium]